MKIFKDDGEYIDLPCEKMTRLFHHCYWYGICECSSGSCRYWKDKDWQCKIMNE